MGSANVEYWGLFFWFCDYLYIGCSRSCSLGLQRHQYQLHVHIWDWLTLQASAPPVLQACNGIRLHLVHLPMLVDTTDKASRHVSIAISLLYLCSGHILCSFVLHANTCNVLQRESWADENYMEHPDKSFRPSSLSSFLFCRHNHINDCMSWNYSNCGMLHGLRELQDKQASWGSKRGVCQVVWVEDRGQLLTILVEICLMSPQIQRYKTLLPTPSQCRQIFHKFNGCICLYMAYQKW